MAILDFVNCSGKWSKLNMVSKIILTCGCGNTDKFAVDAFNILFPKEKVPSVMHSLGVVRDDLLRTVVNGLVEGKEKYAYFIWWTKGSVAVWDLIKGVQIR